jgi:hypothetical protein
LHVEGGFVTKLGKYQAAWTRASLGGNYTVSFQAPHGMLESLELPCLQNGRRPSVLWIDGKNVSERDAVVDGDVVKMAVARTGGNHTIVVG